MDERQLRILRELGELGSVTAVAEALYVTPSAVSQQLRLLQRSIAVPLTVREGRRLVLTDAGQALARSATEVATALARAERAVEDFVGDKTGTVTVSAFHSAGATFYPGLLRTLGRPGRPRLMLADEDVAQERFPALTREYDIVIAHRLDHSPPWSDTVDVRELLHEPLDVAVPAHHPLAAKSRLTPSDVASESWIGVHAGFPLLETLDAIGAAANHRVEIIHRVNDFSVAADIVAAGGGLALMPRWTMPAHRGVVLRPLAGVHARRHIDALYRPERAVRRAVATVLDELVRTAGVIRGA
jgi:DNA-binding transcriptional LysR family regulator